MKAPLLFSQPFRTIVTMRIQILSRWLSPQCASLHELWLSLTLLYWTICTGAFYCSTWPVLSGKPEPHVVASNPPLWRQWDRSGITTSHCRLCEPTWVDSMRGKLPHGTVLSQQHVRTVAWCWFISEAVRGKEAFPLKLAAPQWGNVGYNEREWRTEDFPIHTHNCIYFLYNKELS